jgi:hypothetical protein
MSHSVVKKELATESTETTEIEKAKGRICLKKSLSIFEGLHKEEILLFPMFLFLYKLCVLCGHLLYPLFYSRTAGKRPKRCKMKSTLIHVLPE